MMSFMVKVMILYKRSVITLTVEEQRNLRVWSDAKEMSRGTWKVVEVTSLDGLFELAYLCTIHRYPPF